MNQFEKLLVELTKAEICFITIGGIACAFNGLSRSTEVVDIILDNNQSNIKKFLKFISSYSPISARQLTSEDFNDEPEAIRIIEDFPLDVFIRIDQYRYKELEKHIKHFTIKETAIPYLDKSGLILLKSLSSREIDKRNVRQLKDIDD